jgi:pimeloyl-ACP methyl ester carboxylesterase
LLCLARQSRQACVGDGPLPPSWAGAVLAALLVLLAGCADRETAAVIAVRHHMVGRAIAGDGFVHQIYESPGNGIEPAVLDIYLEGDGVPWSTPERIAADPTPRHALALELMEEDPGPSLYLGRPCYFGHAADPGCDPVLWTDRRYGPEVVQSLAAVIDRQRGSRQVRLIGYSGGGALAALLARRVPGVIGLVTISADLDIGAWTRQHGYSPLIGSLDPADEAALPPGIAELHLQGDRDTEVPPATTSRYLDRIAPGSVRRFLDADHRCCWTEIWPQVIAAIRAGG